MSHHAHYAPHVVLKHENIKAMGHEEVFWSGILQERDMPSLLLSRSTL